MAEIEESGEVENPLDIKALLRKTLIRLAEQNNLKPTEIRIRIIYDKAIEALGYELYLKDSGVPERRLSFLLDFVNKKFDSFGREPILNQIIVDGGFMGGGSPPVIQKFAKEFSIEDWTTLSIVVVTVNDETVNPLLLLYNGTTYLRQVYVDTTAHHQNDFF